MARLRREEDEEAPAPAGGVQGFEPPFGGTWLCEEHRGACDYSRLLSPDAAVVERTRRYIEEHKEKGEIPND